MKIKIIYIDLFCGFGGTTTGVEDANYNGESIAEVAVGINHDEKAIECHKANHPNTHHIIEDVRTANLVPLVEIVKQRVKYWQDKGYMVFVALWASLECTNFSNAKGGKPREADSRTLADHLDRYREAFSPDFIQIENVREFMSWGPLDKNGKPESRTRGRDYMRWCEAIKSHGYNYDFRLINAADLGAYTSRIRFFGIFSKIGLPIHWPEATHSKNPTHVKSIFADVPLKKHKPVKEVLDFSDEGNSIFNRKKELSPKTLQRIYAGLVKYIAGGNESFIAKYYSGRPESKVIPVDGPAGTITTADGQCLVQVNKAFLTKYRGNNAKTGINNGCSIEDPAPVVATSNQLGLVNAFLYKYYGKGENVSSIEDPAGTLTTKDRQAIVKADHFIDKQFSSGGVNQSIDVPAGSITTIPKLQLVRVEKGFILKNQFSNIGSSLEEPAPTLLASRHHHYLLNPQWSVNSGGDIYKPCFTLIARMDKSPPYLVSAESGEMAIMVYDTDSAEMVKIKEFMALYGIIDIKMRMLKVPELLKIQGFPANYILKGTETQKKKFIGNSVVPKVAQEIAKALHGALLQEFSSQLKTA